MSTLQRRALLLAMSGCTAALACAQEALPSRGWQQAHEEYAAGHYASAYVAFADLADRGRPDAARIAVQMHRYGPILYRQSFPASREQLRTWQGSIDQAARREPPLLADTGAR